MSDATIRTLTERARSPAQVTVVAAGATTANDIVSLLERFTGGPPPSASVSTCDLAPTLTPSSAIRIIDVPGAAYSRVKIGAVGVGWGNTDEAALAILSGALSASLSRRLGLRSGDTHGNTDGVRKTSRGWRTSGVVVLDAIVETERTPDAIRDSSPSSIARAALRSTTTIYALPSVGSSLRSVLIGTSRRRWPA